MKKKVYSKPCIKEIYIAPEPILQTLNITSSTAVGGGDSKAYDFRNDDNSAGGSSIWDSMNDDEVEE